MYVVPAVELLKLQVADVIATSNTLEEEEM